MQVQPIMLEAVDLLSYIATKSPKQLAYLEE